MSQLPILFTSSNGFEFSIGEQVSIEQYRGLLATAKSDFAKCSDEQLVERRFVAQIAQREQKHIKVFQYIRAAKQAGAAHLYRKALQEIIEKANAELQRRNNADAEAMFGAPASAAVTA